MDRRIAVLIAGAVLVGGVVTVLRSTGDDVTGQPPRPAQPRMLQRFAAPGVLLPEPGERPKPPSRLVLAPGSNLLRLSWGSSMAGEPDPEGAAGYEVRWGREDRLDRSRLVAQPAIQLGGLPAGVDYRMEVRTVDAFGRRSEPARTTGRATGQRDAMAGWTSVDQFTSGEGLDPNRWRLAHRGTCAQAGPGEGDETGRLVITAACGGDPIGLRARAPFRLRESGGVGGELGRIAIQADAPAPHDDLLIELAAGPVSFPSGTRDAPPPPGPPSTAQDYPGLPPGSLQVWISSDTETSSVQVLVPPGTPRTAPSAQAITRLGRPLIGVSHRWELVLYRDRVEALRDGQLVGLGNVAPAWREATALIGFLGRPGGQLRVGIDLIAIRAEATDPPPAVPSPPVTIGYGSSTVDGERMTGVVGGRLLLTVSPEREVNLSRLEVLAGGQAYPLRPAVPGAPVRPATRYAVVADLPVEALRLSGTRRALLLGMRHDPPFGLQVMHADVDLVPAPGYRPPATSSKPAPPPRWATPAVAQPIAQLLDASGQRPEVGRAMARGRLVLEVRMDGLAGQLEAGELAGLAGIEVYLDNQRMATLPTNQDGPGAGGTWRFAMDGSKLAAGPHTIEIRALGVAPNTLTATAFVSFLVAP